MLYFVGNFAIYYNVLKKKRARRGAYIILPVILSTESYLRGFKKKQKNNSNTIPNTREKKY